MKKSIYLLGAALHAGYEGIGKHLDSSMTLIEMTVSYKVTSVTLAPTECDWEVMKFVHHTWREPERYAQFGTLFM